MMPHLTCPNKIYSPQKVQVLCQSGGSVGEMKTLYVSTCYNTYCNTCCNTYCNTYCNTCCNSYCNTCNHPQKMQALEEDRMTKTRNSIWNYANICSSTLVDIDKRLEEVNFTCTKADYRST